MRKNAETTRLLLGIILLLAAGMRVWGLQTQSFSSDELLELDIAKGTALEILHQPDGFPPLYHLMLHGWLKLLGGDYAARWLSMLFGSLTVCAMWRLAPWLPEARSKFFASALLALSPFHIWYSQEARAYPLYCFAAVLALGFFVRALQSDRWQSWMAYGFACVLGIYTHYYFPILIIAALLFLMTEKRTWRQRRRAVLAHAGVLLLSLPGLWLLADDLSYQTAVILSRTPFDLAAFGYTFFSFLAGYAIGPSLRELHEITFAQAFQRALPWLILLAGSLAIFVQNARAEFASRAGLKRITLFLLFPVLLCGVLAEILVVNFKLQYVLWACVPLFICLGRALAVSFNRWSTKLALLVLCGLFALSAYHRRYEASYQNEDARQLAAYLKAKSDRQTPIFVTACYMEEPVRYYLGEDWQIQPLPNVGMQTQPLQEAVSRLGRNGAAEGFWVIYTRAFHGDPAGLFKKTIIGNGLVQPAATFAGIELYQGK